MAAPPSGILRASPEDRSHAELLLHEYYEAVGVLKRDSPEEFTAYLTNESSGFWIAYVEGAPVGCVALRPVALAVGAATECKRLYVRPQFRGLGVAAALLDAMEDFARSIAAEWIYLDSKDDLRDALRTYTRRGYEPCDRYNDNPQATIFMRKRL